MIISGETSILIISIPEVDDITLVDKVIFTMEGDATITKTYPTDVSHDGTYFKVPMNQEDTTALAHGFGRNVRMSCQVNFTDKSVRKTEISSFHIYPTLATETVDGNTPSATDIDKLTFQLVGDVIIAKCEGDVDPEQIAAAVEDYMAKHPIDAVTESEMETYVAGYHDSTKQDVISDLANIRSGAEKGATALQSVPSEYAKMTEVEAKGYQTASEVDSAITSKGYQTETQVNALINSAITEAINGEY